MEKHRTISLRERIRLNLVSAMENSGINQVQLAEKLAISKGTVNNWTRGNNSPDVDMVPKICEVLGISVMDLYSPTEFENQEISKDEKNTPAPSEDGTRATQEDVMKAFISSGLVPANKDLTQDDVRFLKIIIDAIDGWFAK